MLGNNNFGDEINILGRANLPNLEYLSLLRNNIGDPGILGLVVAGWRETLKRLDLRFNRRLHTFGDLSSVVLRYLKSNGWNNLERYDLDDLGYDEEDLHGSMGNLTGRPEWQEGKNCPVKRKLDDDPNKRLKKKQKHDPDSGEEYKKYKEYRVDKILDNGRPWSEDIYNQGSTGTCCPHAVIENLQFVHGRNRMNPYALHKQVHYHYDTHENGVYNYTHYNTGHNTENVLNFVRDFGVLEFPSGQLFQMNLNPPFPSDTKKYAFQAIYNVYERETGNTNSEKNKKSSYKI